MEFLHIIPAKTGDILEFLSLMEKTCGLKEHKFLVMISRLTAIRFVPALLSYPFIEYLETPKGRFAAEKKLNQIRNRLRQADVIIWHTLSMGGGAFIPVLYRNRDLCEKSVWIENGVDAESWTPEQDKNKRKAMDHMQREVRRMIPTVGVPFGADAAYIRRIWPDKRVVLTPYPIPQEYLDAIDETPAVQKDLSSFQQWLERKVEPFDFFSWFEGHGDNLLAKQELIRLQTEEEPDALPFWDDVAEGYETPCFWEESADGYEPPYVWKNPKLRASETMEWSRPAEGYEMEGFDDELAEGYEAFYYWNADTDDMSDFSETEATDEELSEADESALETETEAEAKDKTPEKIEKAEPETPPPPPTKDWDPDGLRNVTVPSVQIGLSSQIVNHHDGLLVALNSFRNECLHSQFIPLDAFAPMNQTVEKLIIDQGGKVYRQRILNAGTKLFGENFHLINQSVTRYEFAQYLRGLDAAVLGNRTSVATHYLLFLLYAGIRLFISDTSFLYSFLREQGLPVHSIDELRIFGYRKFVEPEEPYELPESIRLYFNQGAVMEEWKRLFVSLGGSGT